MLASGLPLVGYGLIFNLWWALPGAVLVIAGCYGWVMEPSTDPDAGHHHDDHDDHDGDDEGAAAELPEGSSEDGDAATGDGDADAPADDADTLVTAQTEEAPVV